MCVMCMCTSETIGTSAMHNIIASERSGVECARDEIYAHCYYELRTVVCSARRDRDI